MSAVIALDWVLRRDRAVVLVALTVAVVLAWTYILMDAGMDTDMAMGDVAMPMPWTPGTFGVMFVMWTVMMVAMMLPSAMPVVLLHRRLLASRAAAGVL